MEQIDEAALAQQQVCIILYVDILCWWICVCKRRNDKSLQSTVRDLSTGTVATGQ
jgi:hypothetical protein